MLALGLEGDCAGADLCGAAVDSMLRHCRVTAVIRHDPSDLRASEPLRPLLRRPLFQRPLGFRASVLYNRLACGC